MDRATRASDALEKALSQKLADIYGKAALKSVKDLKGLFADMADLEEQSPPSWMSERQAQRWRQQELDKLMQKHKAESTVMQTIMAAGVVSVPLLWGFLTDVYRENSTYTADAIKTAVKTRWKPKTQQRLEVEILLKDKQPPFSKIAFANLQTASAMERRLRNEMRQAVLHGENQQKIVRRIRNVMGNSAYNARRIAQPERTRVQSQARADTIREAAEAGVVMHKRWSTRMVNSRDSHVALNGVEIPEGEKFHTIWGNALAYPGDPDAPAKEVINCFVKETRIASNTSVEAAIEREYIGELVTIETRGGIKFTCTPNHPVLTDKGWIAAGALYEGCNILTSGFAENFCSWIYPNKNNVVPCIYDIYQLFSRISFVNRIARGLVNFHGDIPDTDVKVVFSPCFLQNRGKPLFFKKIKHFFFKFSDFEKATFSCKCMIYKFTSLGWRSASRFIRFLRNFCFFFIGGMLETKKLRFAKAANRTAVFKKKTINSSSIQSFSVCDGIDRFPGDVTVDDIISVKRRENVACHVYNLQTENQIYGVNESISQNGEKHNCKFAIVHNCHCVLVPVVLPPEERS